MNREQPKYQTIITWSVWIGSAILVTINSVISILDWSNYSYKMISAKFAFWGTATILLLWFILQRYLKKNGLKWRSEGKTIRIRGIGKRYTFSLLGIILILWFGPFVNYIRSRPSCEHADKNEILILISKFQLGENVPDSEAYYEIKRAIENVRDNRNLPLSNLRVEIEDNVILEDNNFEQAKNLGDKCNATIVIWGKETGAALDVNFYNLKVTRLAAAQQSYKKPIRPDEYSDFVVQYLPNRINFLALLTIGDLLYSGKMYNEAIDVIEEALLEIEDVEIIPEELYTQAEANFRLGSIHQSTGNCRSAVESYTTAITLYPAAHTFNNRGNCFLVLDEYKSALDDYNKAIELNPNYSLAYNNRGLVKTHFMEYDDAINDHTKAIELWPNYSNAYAMRGRVHYLRFENDLAIKDLTSSIKHNPEHIIAYVLRSQVYSEVGEYELALEDANTIIKLNKFDSNGYYCSYLANLGLGNYDQATSDYERAVELGYPDGESYSQELDQ